MSPFLKVRPTVAGKASTFLQLTAVTLVLCTLVEPQVVPAVVEHGVFVAAAVMTSVAGLQYVYRGLVWVQHRGGSGGVTPAAS